MASDNRRATAGGRHRWVFEMLARSGCAIDTERDGVYRVRLAGPLAERLREEEIQVTFRKRQAKNGVQLATPGSWLHDQLIRHARDRGGVSIGYLPPREDLDRETLLRNRRRGLREILEQTEQRYGNLLLFTFRLSLYSEPPGEEVVTQVYDAERRKVIRRPIARRTLLQAQAAPLEGFGPAPEPDVQAGFRAAWEGLQDLVEKRVHELRNAGSEAAQREIEVVERYYRQLIQEEKRMLKSLSSRRSQEESGRKIELLKLEWKRRVQEETDRLQPSAVAVLSAVATLRVPLEGWLCRVEDRRNGAGTRLLWVDLARADAWEDLGQTTPR
jgi:hypothetical protein